MSNMVPGRPRRQQQAYRRANTSLTLMTTNPEEADPYISCSNILDKFSNGNSSSAKDPYVMANGSPLRKNSVGGGIKDFLGISRGSTSRKESSSNNQDQWSVQESVIDELRISTIPRQPKYSYLIGKSSSNAAKSESDFWRKSNAVSIVNNNLYSSRPNQYSSRDNLDYYLPQHNSSSSKRLNDYQNHNNSVQSAAYEDRISTALRKAPQQPQPLQANSNASSAVQKSKSYSNFDFVRRDLNFQVNQEKLEHSDPKTIHFSCRG